MDGAVVAAVLEAPAVGQAVGPHPPARPCVAEAVETILEFLTDGEAKPSDQLIAAALPEPAPPSGTTCITAPTGSAGAASRAPSASTSSSPAEQHDNLRRANPGEASCSPSYSSACPAASTSSSAAACTTSPVTSLPSAPRQTRLPAQPAQASFAPLPHVGYSMSRATGPASSTPVASTASQAVAKAAASLA